MASSEWFDEGLRFTCTQCGNCCSGPPGYVWFDDAEAAAMAKRLGLSVEEFRARYAQKVGARWSIKDQLTPHGYDCVLLERDATTGSSACTVYKERPRQCRTWPFWRDNLKSPRHWKEASGRCPGMEQGISGKGKLYPAEQIRIVRENDGLP